MKLVREINSIEGTSKHHYSPYQEYQIYLLSEDEVKKTKATGKYLLVTKFRGKGLCGTDNIRLVKGLVGQSKIMYGIVFCDTEKEAVLAYKCTVLESSLRKMRNMILNFQDDVKKIPTDAVSMFKEV